MIQVGRCCRWYIRRCRAFTGREYGTLSNGNFFNFRSLLSVLAFGRSGGRQAEQLLLAQSRETVFQLHFKF